MNTSTIDADRELKSRHRALWASGNYAAVAEEVIPSLGPVLVEAAEIGSGDVVLDVGAGAGNAAFPAARRGATVTASDLTPELLDRGRLLAEREGLTISWEVGDAEQLPYPDATFDVVTSCVGVMFAPHHQEAADELTRVLRADGTIALLSWTPAGFIGQMFATMKPYAPAPPPGAQPPPLWGSQDHVAELLGDRVTDLAFRTGELSFDGFSRRGSFREFFKTNYGPTIAVYKTLEAERAAELDGLLDDLAARFTDASGVMTWEYLIAVGRRT